MKQLNDITTLEMAIVLLLIGMTLNNSLGSASFHINPKTLIQKQHNLTLQYYEILDLARNVPSKEYIRDVYDCSDMSTDLIIKLRNNGYKAMYVNGYANFSGYYDKHTWVRVWIGKKSFDIEATNGRFIYPQEYFKEYVEQ